MPATRHAVVHRLAPFLLLQALLALTSPPAAADWPPGGRAVALAPERQALGALVEHPLCGPALEYRSAAVLVWEDQRVEGGTGIDLRAQVLDFLSAGWLPEEGLVVAGGPGFQYAPIAAFSGQVSGPLPGPGHGVLVAYRDQPPGHPEVLRLKRVLEGGFVPPWPDTGVVVTDSFESAWWAAPRLLGTPEAGAIVAWRDRARGDYRVQRYATDGAPLWDPAGVALADTNPQIEAHLAADGLGTFAAWLQYIPGEFEPSFEIRAIRLDAAGAPAPGWPAEGRFVTYAGGGGPFALPKAVALDQSGAGYVVWGQLGDLYAQRYLPDGTRDPRWPVGGRALVTAPGEAVFGGSGWAAGSLVVAWADRRGSAPGSTAPSGLYAQRLLEDASLPAGWTEDGVLVTPTDDPQVSVASLVVAPDATATLAWTSATGAESRLSLSRVAPDGGHPQGWPATGAPVSGPPGAQLEARLIGDGFGGVFAGWSDHRDFATQGSDVYARWFGPDGTSNTAAEQAPGVTLRLGAPRPNPSRGMATLALELPAAGPVEAWVVDLSGRRVRTLAHGTVAAGTHALRWDGCDESGRPVPAGFYFACAATLAGTAVARLVRLR